MDVPVTTPAEDRIDRPAVSGRAYELFWDCAESDGAEDLPPSVVVEPSSAAGAYERFWEVSD
jgi:hypothetical protein